MKKTLAAIALVLALASPSSAQQTQSAMLSEIASQLATNGSNMISAQALRSVLTDMVVSYIGILPLGISLPLGSASLTTSSTIGFPYIPATAGAPTGVPAPMTGMVPLQFDATNNKLWVYSGGAWRGVAVSP